MKKKVAVAAVVMGLVASAGAQNRVLVLDGVDDYVEVSNTRVLWAS